LREVHRARESRRERITVSASYPDATLRARFFRVRVIREENAQESDACDTVVVGERADP
jgi:hypothetical protein